MKEILKKIEDSIDKEKDNTGRNSMGCQESFYNPYYLVAMCFTDDKSIKVSESKLSAMSKEELENLIELAVFASDVFY